MSACSTTATGGFHLGVTRLFSLLRQPTSIFRTDEGSSVSVALTPFSTEGQRKEYEKQLEEVTREFRLTNHALADRRRLAEPHWHNARAMDDATADSLHKASGTGVEIHMIKRIEVKKKFWTGRMGRTGIQTAMNTSIPSMSLTSGIIQSEKEKEDECILT